MSTQLLTSLAFLIISAGELAVYGSPLPKGGGSSGGGGRGGGGSRSSSSSKSSKSSSKSSKSSSKSSKSSFSKLKPSSSKSSSSGTSVAAGNGYALGSTTHTSSKCSDADRKAGKCDKQGGLTKGQIIAIAVCVSVAVLAIFILLAVCIRKRRKARKTKIRTITEVYTTKPAPWYKRLFGGGKSTKTKGSFVEVSQKDEAPPLVAHKPSSTGEAAEYYDAPPEAGLGLPESLKTRPVMHYETPYYETPESVGLGLPRELKRSDPYRTVSADSSIYDGVEGVKPQKMY